MKRTFNSLSNRCCPLLLVSAFLLAACGGPVVATPTPTPTIPPTSTSTTTATLTASPTAAETPTQTQTATNTATATVTPSPTITLTPTITQTPTITLTPTRTPSPTPDYPKVTVKMQANCRYGPGTAYLYRWGLYPGDQAEVRGRNWDGSWLWIQPYPLKSGTLCWASKIVLNETVDPAKVHFVQIALPHTTFAGPPSNVQAVRSGNHVTVSWSEVPLSEDKRRGYLIEAEVCENTLHFPEILHTDSTSITIRDDQDCKEKSSALLYTAEKHGYSDPVKVPWP